MAYGIGYNVYDDSGKVAVAMDNREVWLALPAQTDRFLAFFAAEELADDKIFNENA